MRSLARRSVLRTLALGPAVAAASASAGESVAVKAPRPPDDPDLLEPVVPWARVLTAPELETLSALCDVIMPAEGGWPAASAVGVPAFIDEWIGAPYPQQQTDQIVVRGGLAWLDVEAQRRYGRAFVSLADAEKTRLADDICHLPRAAPRLRPGATFFDRVRSLVMTGYYTTLEGMKDVGYVGNVPSATFEGPPREVLVRLKLAR